MEIEGSDRLEIHQAEWRERVGENIDVKEKRQLWQLSESSGGNDRA